VLLSKSVDKEEVSRNNQWLEDWFAPIFDVRDIFNLIANVLENR
jgi:hemolysin-activating ACP:hemolysin acyltransferase